MQATIHPQEVEVFYILPAIRRELSIALKDLGKSQREIAKLLGVTEAAVSQYISKKRGQDVRFPAELAAAIRKAAPHITDRDSMIKETQRILSSAKDNKLTCKLHEQVADVPKGCDVCFR
jgi:predicted transcriptional regulator